MRLCSTTVIRDDDSACLDGRPQLLLTWLVNILVARKMDTFLGPYPSIPFSSLYPSLHLQVMAPLCIPPFVHSNNQPTHHWGIHHRAEGFSGRAPRRGVRIDAADCWSLGRFRGFGKLYAWCERYSIDAPREVAKLEELVPRVLRSGGTEGDRIGYL